MNIKKYIVTIILVIIGLSSINAQAKTTFGLQYKPILPIEALNVTKLNLAENGLNVTLSPQLGLNFGAVIRWEILEKLSIETGLNYNKRSFTMDAMGTVWAEGRERFGDGGNGLRAGEGTV